MVFRRQTGFLSPLMKSPSSATKSLRIDQIDRNFASSAGKTNLVWLDAFDSRLSLRGLGWPKENYRTRTFWRFPKRAEKSVRPDVKVLSQMPSGVFLSFFTDSPDISIRMEVGNTDQMDHMPASGMAGAELYLRVAGVWHPAGVAKPSLTETLFQRPLLEDAARTMRECRVYLPLYKGVEAVALGFARGAKVRPSPVPAGQKPLLFYGTSITQGGCANTAGSDYVSTLGRMLGAEVLNLGFSGNGRGEPEVAKLIREVDAEVYVLDFLTNADVGKLEQTLPNFIRLLREKRRKASIAIVSCPAFDKTLWNPTRRAADDRKRDIAMRSYLDLKAAGDNNLFFIDGNGILPAGLSGAYVDGVHPTSHGFAIMAERMLPQLQAIRSREGP